MTIQQEAATLIKELPDDTVKILVELIKKMRNRVSTSDNSPIISPTSKRHLGIASGKYIIPDDIDSCNDEIARMFEVVQ